MSTPRATRWPWRTPCRRWPRPHWRAVRLDRTADRVTGSDVVVLRARRYCPSSLG
jgi:hypothetical protein